MSKTLKIRVVIDHEEDIFRDFSIPETATFEDFHKAILKSFQFPNEEMASFYLSNDQWDKGEEIPLFDMSERENPLTTMANLQLADRINQTGQKLVYVYDFFLMWCFFVEVVEIEKAPTNRIELTNSFGNSPDPQSKEPDFSIDTEDLSGLDNEDLDSFEEDDDLY